jgi:hypothetical protein
MADGMHSYKFGEEEKSRPQSVMNNLDRLQKMLFMVTITTLGH